LQTCPPDASWKVWAAALLRLCDSGRVLKQPLGRFVRAEAIIWWLDPGSNRLFCMNFRKTPGKRTRAMESRFTYSGITTELPNDKIPATAYRVQGTAYVTGVGEVWTPHTAILYLSHGRSSQSTYPQTCGMNGHNLMSNFGLSATDRSKSITTRQHGW
jgi:hypothetical protein